MKDVFTADDYKILRGLNVEDSIDTLNAIVRERLKVGYSCLTTHGRPYVVSSEIKLNDTHKIYYFTEEIEKVDTYESLVRDLVKCKENNYWRDEACIFARAKRLLEGK